MSKEVSIEDGFQIVMLFLRDFWWEFLRKLMTRKELITSKINKVKDKEGRLKCSSNKDLLHDHNDFFFITVCDGTSDDYFENIIEESMNIPPIEQHGGLTVKEDALFQLAIDFCEYFNRRFQKEGQDSLRFAINCLEDMRKKPKVHKIEWDLWNQTVINVTEKDQKSLGFF